VLGCNWPYLAVVKHLNKLTELNYYTKYTTKIIPLMCGKQRNFGFSQTETATVPKDYQNIGLLVYHFSLKATEISV
jgi:hypothetical protein